MKLLKGTIHIRGLIYIGAYVHTIAKASPWVYSQTIPMESQIWNEINRLRINVLNHNIL